MKNEFKSWMTEMEEKSANTASSYCSSINSISQHYFEQNKKPLDLYTCDDILFVNALKKDYGIGGKYEEFGNKGKGTVRNAIAAYARFLEYKKSGGVIEVKTNKKRRSTNNTTKRNSRYKKYAIGSSQNSLIRNILSRLGNESFTEDDWKETKKHFTNRCAYCGTEDKLDMDHAIPINREKLGEHRLGNIVPACSKCNSNKGDKDYKEYLGSNTERIKIIEEYMNSKNYVPLEDNDKLRKILDLAYEEVSSIAERYITIIDDLFMRE
ncbi:hypothetical protein AGMMS49928_24340 [Spirochaetia bacterium]|nr:hypothetical protein AGMMS49928_24340 [Spirochaetia bacterium]